MKLQRRIISSLIASIFIANYGVVVAETTKNIPKYDAQTWPSKPLRLMVGFPAGSSPDATARTLADALSKTLNQTVMVENKPGAAGNIAADMVAKATDGHTLGVVINGNLTTAKQLNPKLPYDPAKDFAFISLLTTAPLVLVAPANLPQRANFFQAAAASGSQWNYGSPGNGTVAHLGIEVVKGKVPGLNAVHVPFAGTPQILTAMLGGQVQMALVAPNVAMPQVRAGKLQAIGLTGGRSTLVTDVPPLSDAGLQGMDLEVWNALIGPASLPKPVVEKLSQAVVAVLRTPEVRQRLFNQGWQAVGTSPEGLELRVKQEAALLGGIIQARGIKSE